MTNAPKLSVENGTYLITIGSLKLPVVLTVAGQGNGTAQRFGVRVPVADSATGTSFKGYPAVLYATDDPDMLDYDNDGNFEMANIGCESCHGPGSNHILNGGDPTKIVNPANLKPA